MWRPSSPTQRCSSPELLLTMPVPLFPPGEEYSALNTALCREYRDWLRTCSGGGPRRQFQSSMFPDAQGVTAGGYLTVQQEAATGTLFVDTGEVEAAFGSVYNELNRLNDAVKQLKDNSALVEQVGALRNRIGEARTSFRRTSGTGRAAGPASGRGGRGQRGTGSRGRRGGPRGGGETSDF